MKLRREYMNIYVFNVQASTKNLKVIIKLILIELSLYELCREKID